MFWTTPGLIAWQNETNDTTGARGLLNYTRKEDELKYVAWAGMS